MEGHLVAVVIHLAGIGHRHGVVGNNQRGANIGHPVARSLLVRRGTAAAVSKVVKCAKNAATVVAATSDVATVATVAKAATGRHRQQPRLRNKGDTFQKCVTFWGQLPTNFFSNNSTWKTINGQNGSQQPRKRLHRKKPRRQGRAYLRKRRVRGRPNHANPA